jgi:hypothetical protein
MNVEYLGKHLKLRFAGGIGAETEAAILYSFVIDA